MGRIQGLLNEICGCACSHSYYWALKVDTDAGQHVCELLLEMAAMTTTMMMMMVVLMMTTTTMISIIITITIRMFIYVQTDLTLTVS